MRAWNLYDGPDEKAVVKVNYAGGTSEHVEVTGRDRVKEIRESLVDQNPMEMSFEEVPTISLEELMTQRGDGDEEEEMSQNLLDPQGNPSPLVAPSFSKSGAPWRGPAGDPSAGSSSSSGAVKPKTKPGQVALCYYPGPSPKPTATPAPAGVEQSGEKMKKKATRVAKQAVKEQAMRAGTKRALKASPSVRAKVRKETPTKAPHKILFSTKSIKLKSELEKLKKKEGEAAAS